MSKCNPDVIMLPSDAEPVVIYEVQPDSDPAITIDTQPTAGTTDYDRLKNKPQINGVELKGNKTDAEIGIEEITNTELEALLNGQI